MSVTRYACRIRLSASADNSPPKNLQSSSFQVRRLLSLLPPWDRTLCCLRRGVISLQSCPTPPCSLLSHFFPRLSPCFARLPISSSLCYVCVQRFGLRLEDAAALDEDNAPCVAVWLIKRSLTLSLLVDSLVDLRSRSLNLVPVITVHRQLAFNSPSSRGTCYHPAPWQCACAWPAACMLGARLYAPVSSGPASPQTSSDPSSILSGTNNDRRDSLFRVG